MSKCAYCDLDRPPTKEHIWPKALIDKYDGLHTYNPRRNNFHRGEPVVNDVCAVCNNKLLSPLDAYLSDRFDCIFSKIVEPGQTAEIEYEFQKLLRSLLKISYNSSRSSEDIKPSQLLSRYAKYILNGGYAPTIHLRLQIVTSARAINLDEGAESAVHPTALRVGTLAYDGPLANRFLVRLVGINSYWFYIAIPYKSEPPHKWREFLDGLADWRTPTGIEIPSDKSNLMIPVSRTTYMHPALLGSLLGAMQA